MELKMNAQPQLIDLPRNCHQARSRAHMHAECNEHLNLAAAQLQCVWLHSHCSHSISFLSLSVCVSMFMCLCLSSFRFCFSRICCSFFRARVCARVNSHNQIKTVQLFVLLIFFLMLWRFAGYKSRTIFFFCTVLTRTFSQKSVIHT